MFPPSNRAALLALLLAGASAHAADEAPSTWPPSPPVDFAHVPWTEGESLTYLISWGPLYAAEGTFVAHQKGGRWAFRLHLSSRGVVDSYYPFSAYCWSMLAPGPWRSAEYGEYRFEPGRTIRERTRIDYPAHLGTRETWHDGKTYTFPIAEDTVDDVGTMLYHLRTGAWQPATSGCCMSTKATQRRRHWPSAGRSTSECSARGPCSRSFGLQVLPGKGTHHRGGLMLWMTDDDRRLPVHAALDFRYGTFTIDLLKVGHAEP